MFYFVPCQGPGRKGQFTESRVITQLLSCLLLLEVKQEGQVCASASPVASLWIAFQGIKKPCNMTGNPYMKFSGVWGGKEKHKWLQSLVFEPRDGWRFWLVFHRHWQLTSPSVSFRASEGPLSRTVCIYWMYFLPTSLPQQPSPLCQPCMEGAKFKLRPRAFLHDFSQHCVILPRAAHNRFKVCS